MILDILSSFVQIIFGVLILRITIDFVQMRKKYRNRPIDGMVCDPKTGLVTPQYKAGRNGKD